MFKNDAISSELYLRVDEVLFYIWDPLGVKDSPEARDEYESYAPAVFSMLKQNKCAEEISVFLLGLEMGEMGLENFHKKITNQFQVAELLIRHKDWINEKLNN